MLSTAEINAMRSVVEDAMPGTAILSTRQRTSDGQGGQTNTYVPAGTVQARLDYAGAEGEMSVGGRVADVQGYMLTVPSTTSVPEEGRVSYAGVDYEVSEVLTREPWDLCQRVRVFEID